MRLLDESKIINIFKKRLGIKNSDDVERFKISNDLEHIVKIDTLVASTDVPPSMPLNLVAEKSVVGPTSDFAAKGIQPKYGIISFNIPAKLTISQVDKLAKGIAEASKRYKIKILGGDTNEGQELTISVCLCGIEKKPSNAVRRNGARPGDVIFTTGFFGYSAAGLEIILNGKKGPLSFSKKAKSAVFKPKARLGFGIKNRKYFSSSMDSSDGLAITLNELSRQGNCMAVITHPPVTKELINFASKNKIDWRTLIFEGGEEYEIVFTANRKYKKILQKNAKLAKIRLQEIGYVAKGRGVYTKEGNSLVKVQDKGWRHLN